MPTIAPGPERNDSSLLLPDIYPRLAYDDEHAAVEYLARVFQLEEIRPQDCPFPKVVQRHSRVESSLTRLSHPRACLK